MTRKMISKYSNHEHDENDYCKKRGCTPVEKKIEVKVFNEDEFMKLPDYVRSAIWQHGKTACPNCGLSGVPQSWAIATYNAIRDKLARELNLDV